jgi:hypothetical protein
MAAGSEISGVPWLGFTFGMRFSLHAETSCVFGLFHSALPPSPGLGSAPPLGCGSSRLSPGLNGRNLARPGRNRHDRTRPALTEDYPMPGPRPQPIKLRLLRGNPGRRPVPSTFEPPQPPAPPSPPSFLKGYALDEWRRVALGLHVFGLLGEADVM